MINYFWLNANPNTHESKWSFSKMAIGDVDTWIARKKNGYYKSNFKKIQPYDKIIGFESGKIIAILEAVDVRYISKEGADKNNEVVSLKMTEFFQNPIGIEILKKEPLLNKVKAIHHNQGTLLSLTEEEFNIIENLIKGNNNDK